MSHAVTGPSPPGISLTCLLVLQRIHEISCETYHADVVAVQKDLGELGVVLRVVASLWSAGVILPIKMATYNSVTSSNTMSANMLVLFGWIPNPGSDVHLLT